MPVLEQQDETNEEFQARLDTEVELDQNSKEFINGLIDKLMIVCQEIAGHPFYPYQVPLARRIFESLLINDGATITALFSRQSGKTETVADVVATAMIMFPLLAKIYPDLLWQFKEGVWVGTFAPVEYQAGIIFARIVTRLGSDTAAAMLHDPEINDRVIGKGSVVHLRNCHSRVRRITAHPRATIEGESFHIIILDEAQGATREVVDKSIQPMGAAYNATMVFTGTPARDKGVFYRTIQENKRRALRRGRQNHFEVDWRTAGKHNPLYKKSVQNAMLSMGEDSDEFRLSYRIQWLLDRGMFTTFEKLDKCEDISMQSVVHAYNRTPVCVGIDCARKQDRTVVTVVFVDWDNPDHFGYYNHRILNWLDLEGMDWEEQYFRIVDFLANYNVYKIGIDVGGLGDVVAQRLKILLPYAEVVELGSAQSDQSTRWKHLRQLIDRRQISWPAGAKVKRLKTYRRFRAEMEDLEINFKGPYVLAECPKESDAHDDYCILYSDPIMVQLEDQVVIKQIGQVQIGDRVLSDQGNWDHVENVTTNQPYGSRVAVKLWGSPGFTATGNHPVLTTKGFVPAGELTKDSKVCYRIDRTEHDIAEIDMFPFFSEAKSRNAYGVVLGGTEEKDGLIRYNNPKARWINRYVKVNSNLMELLGYYLAEGSCGAHNVQFTFGSNERDLIDRVRELFYSVFHIDGMSENHSANNATTISISSVAIREFFKSVLPGTASEKKLPTLITQARLYLQQDFLRAYWLGDGCFSVKSNENWIADTTSSVLALQLRDMMLRQGIVPTYSVSHRAGKISVIRGREIKHNHDLHYVRVAQPDSVNKFSEIMQSSIRKASGWKPNKMHAKIIGDFLVSSVRTIDISDWKPGEMVSNLLVEKDHTFTLPGATTHNCDSLALACVLTLDDEDRGDTEVLVMDNVFYSKAS